MVSFIASTKKLLLEYTLSSTSSFGMIVSSGITNNNELCVWLRKGSNVEVPFVVEEEERDLDQIFVSVFDTDLDKNENPPMDDRLSGFGGSWKENDRLNMRNEESTTQAGVDHIFEYLSVWITLLLLHGNNMKYKITFA